jgi:hypothetical protein
MSGWRIRVALVLAVTCAGWAAAREVEPQKASASSSDQLAARQFQGVSGTRQIGPSFPEIQAKKQVGTRSVFLVETDARTAMTAFVERAGQLGFMRLPNTSGGFCGSAPYGPPTDTPAPGEARVVCGGRYGRPDNTTVSIDMTVCESCPDPESTAIVVLEKSPVTDLSPMTGLEPISTTLSLPADTLRSVRRPTDATLALGNFPMVKGARLAAPLLSESSLCTFTWVALLKIAHNPVKAFKAYANQMFGGPTPPVTASIGGHRVTQRSDPNALLTLLDGGSLKHPWMLASACDPTVD